MPLCSHELEVEWNQTTGGAEADCTSGRSTMMLMMLKHQGPHPLNVVMVPSEGSMTTFLKNDLNIYIYILLTKNETS